MAEQNQQQPPNNPPQGTDGKENQQEKKSKAKKKKGRQQALTHYVKDFEVKPVQQSRAKLGVMLGVYFPSIQNVFGVIMFLRLSWMVGLMGIAESFTMVFLCCLCTFLTTLSISAICTNGFMGRGGPYFLISRSLGPGVGSAVGLLFCLANTIAIAMYVIGGVEILLMYLAPEATLGGAESLDKTGFIEPMTNSQRLYGIGFLFVTFVIVVAGVKITQAIAPFSLAAVIISIIAIYAGGVQKYLQPDTGPYICVLEGRTLKLTTYMPTGSDVSSLSDPNMTCSYCVANTSDSALPIWKSYCTDDTSRLEEDKGPCSISLKRRDNEDKEWYCRNIYNPDAKIQCKRGTTGFNTSVMKDGVYSQYLQNEDASMDHKPACFEVNNDKKRSEVFQDIDSSFFFLLAIYFPSVTGIATGANMSGDLKDPQKSIPWGTLAAQLTTSFVYLSYTILFGSSIERDLLRDKYGHSLGGVMPSAMLAWPHEMVVLIGTLLSTFGAGIQSLCCWSLVSRISTFV